MFRTEVEYYLREDLEEPAVAGWLLVAETCVPILFDAVLPSFERLGADLTYFTAHVHIDADEHATWMAEAVEELATDEASSTSIVEGMAEAWAETIGIPDRLWRSRCA